MSEREREREIILIMSKEYLLTRFSKWVTRCRIKNPYEEWLSASHTLTHQRGKKTISSYTFPFNSALVYLVSHSNEFRIYLPLSLSLRYTLMPSSIFFCLRLTTFSVFSVYSILLRSNSSRVPKKLKKKYVIPSSPPRKTPSHTSPNSFRCR